MLFDPDRHEALGDVPWDASRVRDAIRSIVDDIEHRCVASGRWPVHPLDDEGDTPRTGFKGLYLGRAGVLWSLWYLQRRGAVALAGDPCAGVRDADAAYRDDPDTGNVVPSYYLGEVGILLVLWRMTGSGAAADRLHASIRSNIGNPTREALWAAPGTMVAAWHLWEATGEERWRVLFLENVDELWRTWCFDPRLQCHLWTQDLYGHVVQYLGAAHGFAGNVYPLLKGAALLDADRREVLYERMRGHAARHRKVRRRRLQLAARDVRAATRSTGYADAVVPRRTRRGDRVGGLSAASFSRHGRHADRRRPRDLAGRAPGQGSRPLPRYGGQRLRVPRAVPAYR